MLVKFKGLVKYQESSKTQMFILSAFSQSFLKRFAVFILLAMVLKQFAGTFTLKMKDADDLYSEHQDC